MSSRLSLLSVLALTGLLLAHGSKPWPVPEEERARKNPVASNEASLKEGKALYETNCALCHGEKGDGKGKAAKSLPVKPEEFTHASMMEKMADGELFYKMSEGRMPMPGFKSKLTEEQRWQLVNYVRTFAKKAPAKKGDAAKKTPAHH